MTYTQAEKLKKHFAHLVGKQIMYRADLLTVEDIKIAPIDGNALDMFLNAYYRDGDVNDTIFRTMEVPLQVIFFIESSDETIQLRLKVEDYARDNGIDISSVI